MNNRYNPNIHHRRSIRLKGGLYFITIVTQNRLNLFGKIPVRAGSISAQMILNDAGEMVEKWYYELEHKFSNIKCREYIVMPNHFHAIIEIVGATFMVDPIKEKGQPQGIAPTDFPTNSETDNPTNKTIGDIIGAFKSITTNEHIKNIKSNKWKRFDGKLWQRNYWEHIIRNEKAYINISDYVKNNPYNWDKDSLK